MKVYVVLVPVWENVYLERVYSTREAAQARVQEILDAGGYDESYELNGKEIAYFQRLDYGFDPEVAERELL